MVFQSAPGREAGRCVATTVHWWSIGLFQSAPGREAGRCFDSSYGFKITGHKFQSAPGREAGRCMDKATKIALRAVVSIRARP